MSPARLRTGQLAGALLAGLLYVASVQGGASYLLAPLVFVPLFLAMTGASDRQAAVLGAVTGVVACSLGFHWIFPAVRRFGDLGRPAATLAFVLFVAAQATRFAVQAWLTARLRPRAGFLGAAALAFVVAETVVPSPMRWSFAIAAAGRLELLQVGELGGPAAVALPFVLSAAALSRMMVTRRVRWIALAVAPLVVSALFGAARLRQVARDDRLAAPLRVGLVQGAMPLDHDPVREAAALVEELRLQRELESAGADLVVWAESSLPVALDVENADRAVATLLGDAPKVPTIVGAEMVERSSAGDRSYNSALVLDRTGVVERYDKRALLPFSEQLPLGDIIPSLRAMLPSARIQPGGRGGPREVLGHPVAVTLCYEDALAGAMLDAAGGDAELLVNLTNDAWFDGSEESALHLAHARMRAIEHRRYLVHATSTGVTAVVDPSGRVIASAPVGRAAALLADVRWRTGRTLFSLTGERGWWAISLLSLVLALVRPGSARQPHRDRRIIPRPS